MINYRIVTLPDFEQDVKIGVIVNRSVSVFLRKFKVNKSVSQTEYEDFLLYNLVPDFKALLKQAKQELDQKELHLFKHSIVEQIYKLNPKLQPGHIVIDGDRLLHRMDSVKAGGPSEPTLPVNPGWLGTASTLINPEPIQEFAEYMWEEVKKDGIATYYREHVRLLETDLPIMQLSSTKWSAEEFILEYLIKKCDGNLFLAKNDKKLWIGYVLAFMVPGIQELTQLLSDNGYLSTFTENVVYTSLYLSVLNLNPELNFDLIDWNQYGTEEPSTEKPDNVRPVSSRTPVGVRKTDKSGKKFKKSSKEEAEQEKPKFTDVPYDTIMGLADNIKTRIIGQDKAVDSVCESIAVSRVGLRGDKKPVGTFLFAGKTGVGKTELAKVMAELLTEREPIRIDCSEYQQAHEISKIFGAPPGYVGFEDDSRHPHQGAPPTTVASKLKANPFSVVLFDEIEKADPAINNVLLQIMDEGHVTSGRGETISFNNAIVILTSNVGTAEAEEACQTNRLGFGDDNRDFDSLSEVTIKTAIKERFKPEFRNRLTETVIFNGLTKDICKGIVDVLLAKTKQNLEKAQHVTMEWDDSIREFILEEGFSEEFGAREMERVIQKKIEFPLARYLLENHYKAGSLIIPKGSTVRLSIESEEVIFNVEEDKNGEETDFTEGLIQSANSTSRRKSGTNSH